MSEHQTDAMLMETAWHAEENVDQIVAVGAIKVVVPLLSYFRVREGEVPQSRWVFPALFQASFLTICGTIEAVVNRALADAAAPECSWMGRVVHSRM